MGQLTVNRKHTRIGTRSLRARRILAPIDVFRAKWRESAGQPQSTLVNPYPGLRSFNVDEAHIFRARSNQIRALRRTFGSPSASGEAQHMIMVIGGSSSGKSSIVRAGLLADIHSLEMPDGQGNWYVAECRPAESPMLELLSGLANMIIDAIFRELDGRSAKLAVRVERALSAVGVSEAASQTDDLALRAGALRRVRSFLDARLWSDRHRSQPAAVAPALTLFVREALNRLDKHLHPLRPGPPRLLVSVDQFEEIFRSPADSEKQALFDLIRFIDRADQQRVSELYLVASMRSEELHRCSEVEGIADIVNRSVHLVELVSPNDAKQAIVEPGRLTLQAYGFPVIDDVNWPYDKAAVDAMVESYRGFASGPDHRPDSLPLLQHFLRMLWDSSVGAWVENRAGNIHLLIDSGSLSAIPGWDDPIQSQASNDARSDGEPQNRLARVLNNRADAVYEKAIIAWCDAAEDASERTRTIARTVLTAAFVSLVRQDDRRRVVRDWQTIEGMLEVSGEVERYALTDAYYDGRRGERAGKFKKSLEAAMREFEQATLIERRADAGSRKGHELPDRYSVCHESFIRNWKQYANWVREASKASATLHAIYNDLNDPSTEAVPENIVTAGREADLSAVIGDVDGDAKAIEPAVQKRAMPRRFSGARRGWASQAWILTEISRVEIPGARFDAPGFLAELGNMRRNAILARKNQSELAAQAAEAKAEAANANAKRATAESQAAEAKAKAARAEAETANANAKRAVAESREAEEKARSAVAERVKAEHDKRISQRLLIFISAVSCAFAICFGITYYFYTKADNLYQQKEFNLLRFTIAKLGLVGFGATEMGGEINRPLYRDRDLWLALNALDTSEAVDWAGANAEIRNERDEMRDKIADRARQVLADLTFVPSSTGFHASDGFNVEKVKCLSLSTDSKATLFSDLDSRSGPAEVRYRIQNGTLQYASGKSEDFRDIETLKNLEPFSAVCVSPDAASLLVLSQKDVQPRPLMVMIQWNEVPVNEQAQWSLLAYSIRGFQSWSSNALYATSPIEISEISNTEYISKDNVVGFVVPLHKVGGNPPGTQPEGVLWTNEGYSAQIVDKDTFGKLPLSTSICRPRKSLGSWQCQVEKTMETGERVVATYIKFTGIRKACVNEVEYCLIKVQLYGNYNNKEATIEFSYVGRRPRGFKIDRDYLSIQGDDKIVRRFFRNSEVAKNLIALRWKHLRCGFGPDILGDDFARTTIRPGEMPSFYTQTKLPPYPDGHDCSPPPAGAP